jgi:hypothetical protein
MWFNNPASYWLRTKAPTDAPLEATCKDRCGEGLGIHPETNKLSDECYCDEHCASERDCCSDYEEECVIAPTLWPTSPTAAPTAAPSTVAQLITTPILRHPCDDGSHGCDSVSTACKVVSAGLLASFTCECLEGFQKSENEKGCVHNGLGHAQTAASSTDALWSTDSGAGADGAAGSGVGAGVIAALVLVPMAVLGAWFMKKRSSVVGSAGGGAKFNSLEGDMHRGRQSRADSGSSEATSGTTPNPISFAIEDEEVLGFDEIECDGV